MLIFYNTKTRKGGKYSECNIFVTQLKATSQPQSRSEAPVHHPGRGEAFQDKKVF